MGFFKNRPLVQFALISFVLVLALALCLAFLIGPQLNAAIAEVQTLTAGGVTAPAAADLEASLLRLRGLVYGSIAAGCIVLFGLLMLLFWRDWRTISRQQADLIQTNTDLRAANQELLSMAKFPDENPHLMLRLSETGEVLYANMAALSLLSDGGRVTLPEAWRLAAREAMAETERRELEDALNGRILACTFVPLPELAYVSVYAIDITRRRTAERALQQTEESTKVEREELLTELSRLTTIIETTSDYVAMFTLDGDILYVNPAGMAMVGRLGEVYRQLTMADFQPPEVADQMAGHIFPLVRKYEVWSGESALLHVDGTAIPVSQVITLIRNKRGEPIAIGTVARDITERKQNENRLQRAMETAQKAQYAAEEARQAAEMANQAKTTFLANMSHELRTPLNSIIGFADVLLEGLDGDLNERMEEDVRLIRESGNHLRGLIGDILDMSKIEAGRMDLRYEEIDMAQLANDVMATAAPLAQEKRLFLHLDIDENVRPVQADRTRLRQIMWNIVGNAIKFTEKGSVTISVQGQSNHVLCSVRDTGIGIKEEHAAVVFEQFRQIDGGLNRIAGGTGLGMPITKKLVELHGGDIWIESVYGQGSTFLFTIPYHPPKNKPAPVDALASA